MTNDDIMVKFESASNNQKYSINKLDLTRYGSSLYKSDITNLAFIYFMAGYADALNFK